jgi:hypothetical protein
MTTLSHSLSFYLSHYEDMQFFYGLKEKPENIEPADWQVFQRVKDHALDQGRDVVQAALESLSQSLQGLAHLEPKTRGETSRLHWYAEGHLAKSRRHKAFGLAGVTLDPVPASRALCLWLFFYGESRMRAKTLVSRLSVAGVAGVSLGGPPSLHSGLAVFGALPLKRDVTMEDCQSFVRLTVAEKLIPHWQEVLDVAEL